MTRQKSAYCPPSVLSQLYSNCRVRHTALSSAPMPGNISSSRTDTGRGSITGKPSKATARNGGRPAARDRSGSTVAAVTEAAARVVNVRRSRSLSFPRVARRQRSHNCVLAQSPDFSRDHSALWNNQGGDDDGPARRAPSVSRDRRQRTICGRRSQIRTFPLLDDADRAELERRLGTRLLQRTTRKLSLTDSGARLAAQARRLLADYDDAIDGAIGEAASLRGNIKLSAPPLFASRHVAPLVRAFLERHPDITLQLALEDRLVDLIDERIDMLDLVVANGFVTGESPESYWYDYSMVAGGHSNIIADARNWPPMNGPSLSGSQVDHVWLNDGAGRFRDVTRAVGAANPYDGRAVAVADLWNRGVLDVVIAYQRGPLLVYRNPVAPGRGWIGFFLEGTRGNRSAIGAEVRLYWAGNEQMQQVDGGSGFASQRQRWIHFGLGQTAGVDSAVIRWPSGAVQRVPAPAVDQLHRIREPE